MHYNTHLAIVQLGPEVRYQPWLKISHMIQHPALSKSQTVCTCIPGSPACCCFCAGCQRNSRTCPSPPAPDEEREDSLVRSTVLLPPHGGLQPPLLPTPAAAMGSSTAAWSSVQMQFPSLTHLCQHHRLSLGLLAALLLLLS